MKRRQHRQDRPDRLADVEGMDGPGQRAMALSDVDSDSTCKQQRSSRQVGQKPPTANSQPASQPARGETDRQRETRETLAAHWPPRTDAALTLALQYYTR